MELRIAQSIRHHRKAKDLTQEQLAAALDISPQSVSKWECGDGYPDITLLPRIANYFKITVDELIGNDEAGKETDINTFYDRYWDMDDQPEERFALCKDYYRKYPDHYGVMFKLGQRIVAEKRREEMPLLREICEKIIDNCTDQFFRQEAASLMCRFCEDSELDRWLDLCAPAYDAVRNEVLEERLWGLGKYEESREQYLLNMLYLSIHWLTSRSRYHGKAEMSVELNKRYLAFMTHVAGDGEIPDGWAGYAQLVLLRLAAGYFGCGNIEEGYAWLEKGVALCEKWAAIPQGTPLSLGGMFAGYRLLKADSPRLLAPNGEEIVGSAAYFLMFDGDLLLDVLTRPNGWEWFNGVREDARFRACVERAKALAPQA